tara:strand:+ start:32 stop:1252 length:1221 start_codon:yes stop_codon:yes gene_type:complete
MSQRQVNLKSGSQLAQTAATSVSSMSNQLVKTAANMQAENRRQSERAILQGNKTTEEFVKAYSAQTKSTNEELQTGMNTYIRSQAQLIGDAKAKAESPGATTEDRQEYLRIMQQSQNNLDAIAKWSVMTESNKNSYSLHQQSVETGSSLNRLERGALNNKDLIAFENALLSETTENLSISQGENGGTVISITSNGQTYTRNITDDVRAFSQTGETIKGSAISQDELLTGKAGNVWLAEASKWPDLQSKTVNEIELDESVIEDGKTVGTITGRKTKKATDIYNTIINDHDDFLESKIKINFSKNWDQLCYLGDEYVPKGALRDLSWGTLNNSDWESGVANLRAQIGDDALAKLDLTGGKFDENDYLNLQKQQRTLAKNAMAKFIAGGLQQKDAVVAENITRTPTLDK